MFIQGTTLERGYDLASNVSVADLRPGLLAQQAEADRLYREQAEMCKETMGQTIAYMGTSSNVRDIDLITTALEGPDALMYELITHYAVGRSPIVSETSGASHMGASWASISSTCFLTGLGES